MLLVDTSVWIPFLRGNDSRGVKRLEQLLKNGDAYLCEITFAEICFGARDSAQLRLYEKELRKEVLPRLKVPGCIVLQTQINSGFVHMACLNYYQ